MSLQLINTNIKMHMACPGFVNTTMIRRAQKQAVSFTFHFTNMDILMKQPEGGSFRPVVC